MIAMELPSLKDLTLLGGLIGSLALTVIQGNYKTEARQATKDTHAEMVKVIHYTYQECNK